MSPKHTPPATKPDPELWQRFMDDLAAMWATGTVSEVLVETMRDPEVISWQEVIDSDLNAAMVHKRPGRYETIRITITRDHEEIQ